MSKLLFRARALDASRPLAVWLAEELPELPDYSAISRAVPQMPSGMEKEEECEHHLQRAICTGLIIPTPEVSGAADMEFYERCYPADYKMPKQLIHMQPLCLEQETPEYDLDSEDERWLRQHPHPELTELKLEEMMDKLERSSGQTVLQLSEAKLLLERDDELVDLVYDYWLGKRLQLQHPLIPSVRTESRAGQLASNPYLAFRRRTEKMQTRKNRKNDESSYEKMLKLRRDLSRAASLLELVVRRERHKRELVTIARETAEKRLAAEDFAGQLLAELQAETPVRKVTCTTMPAFKRELYSTHLEPRAPTTQHDITRQRDKRPNKRRKHRHHSSSAIGLREVSAYSSSEEEVVLRGAARAAEVAEEPPPDDGPYAFRRKPGVYYQMPTSSLCGQESDGSESPSSVKENLFRRDKRHRFTLTSLNAPHRRCVGFARRRLGRGGRVLLDRLRTPLDDVWRRIDFPYERSSRRAPPLDPDKRYVRPHAVTTDYVKGKYQWRHAYREHRRERCRGGAADGRRGRRRRRASETSCGSAAELEPHEQEFGRMLEEVNREWLHFRPRTPPTERLEHSSASGLKPDDPLAVQLQATDADPPSKLLTDYNTFTTSEFTLRDLYGDIIDDNLDITVDDSNLDNFGLTDAQVESILDETDLKVLAEDDLKDGRKNSIDLLKPDDADAILEELVKSEVPFLSDARTNVARLGRTDNFGSSVVTISNLDPEPIQVDEESIEEVAPPKAAVVPLPKVERVEKKERVLEDLHLGRGVQLKTVHTKHSPLKKHIISAARRADVGQDGPPQIVAVSMPDSLKARLHGHLLTSQVVALDAGAAGGVVGVVQNGPFATAATTVGVGIPVCREGVTTSASASTSSPRRVTTPLVHLTSAVHQKQLNAATINPNSPLVVAHSPHTLHHVPPNKLKVLHAHTLTQQQRTQLLAASQSRQLPAVVSLSSLGEKPQGAPIQLKAAQYSIADTKNAPIQLKTTGPLTQYYEIKPGQLGKPHLVNVVRHGQPGKATVARLELNDAKKRQIVALDGKGVGAPRHRVSVLDNRQLVRAAIPTVRSVRHPIQLKGRTLVAPQPSTSIAIAASSKAGLPGSVVANLLQKGAMRGQKIAIAGGAAPLANVQAFATFAHSQQLKARQTRLVAQPRANASQELIEVPTTSSVSPSPLPAAESTSDADTTTNGGVRRRGENLTMEVT